MNKISKYLDQYEEIETEKMNKNIRKAPDFIKMNALEQPFITKEVIQLKSQLFNMQDQDRLEMTLLKK